MVEAFNVDLVRRWLECRPDIMNFADDLGMQDRTLLSPAQFRRYITPTFSKLARMCKDAGVHTFLHTDGYVMNIVDQLLDWPIDVLNVQDLVNGIDNLAAEVKNNAAIDLDIDRQRIVPYGAPHEIAELIEEAVRKLGSPEGGLMMKVGIYPPTPPENVDALLTAFERYRTYWWD
jgi:uroporphyrinogen-III decarboxylase